MVIRGIHERHVLKHCAVNLLIKLTTSSQPAYLSVERGEIDQPLLHARDGHRIASHWIFHGYLQLQNEQEFRSLWKEEKTGKFNSLQINK